MIITSLCQTIIVRYARKPIWMPTAPSKLFRLAEHTFYSEEEVKQIRVLQAAYAAQEKSIQEFMKHEFFIPAEQSGGLPIEFIEREKEDDKRIYEENERRNREVAKLKDEVMRNQIQALEDKVVEEKFKREDFLLKRAMEVDEYIRAQKADPMSVVTEDNIDDAIERAIENPVSFEYCIDRRGRRTGITPSQPSDKHQNKAS